MFKFLKIIRSIKKLKGVEPDQKWLARVRLNFNEDNTPARQPAFYKTKFAVALVAIVIILSLVGGGLVQSAQAALPNDTLYPVKLWAEKIQSWTAIGDENKMALALKFAEKRFGEFGEIEKAQGLNEEKREEIIAKITAQAEKHLEKAEVHLQKWSQWQQEHPQKPQGLKERFAERKELLTERKEFITERFAEHKQLLAEKFAACASDSPEILPGCLKLAHPGSEKITELLTDGAGKSGEMPKGLFRAPGIKKKLQGLFEFPLLNKPAHDEGDGGDKGDEKNENGSEDENENE